MNAPDHLIVACYTSGDYEQEAQEKLLPSLRKLHLAHDVREIPCEGSWVANGFACQAFLLRMCRAYPTTHLLFLDVDAVVHTSPWSYLLRLECDLAAHYMRGTELLTGTLYMPPRPRREPILLQWMDRNRKNPNTWDQRNLQAMLAADSTIVVHRLPPEYCCIFDTQRRYTPGIEPVIEHFQASRRFRRSVR